MWINFSCFPLSFSLKHVITGKFIDYRTENQEEFVDYRIEVQLTIEKFVTKILKYFGTLQEHGWRSNCIHKENMSTQQNINKQLFMIPKKNKLIAMWSSVGFEGAPGTTTGQCSRTTREGSPPKTLRHYMSHLSCISNILPIHRWCET